MGKTHWKTLVKYVDAHSLKNELNKAMKKTPDPDKSKAGKASAAARKKKNSGYSWATFSAQGNAKRWSDYRANLDKKGVEVSK